MSPAGGIFHHLTSREVQCPPRHPSWEAQPGSVVWGRFHGVSSAVSWLLSWLFLVGCFWKGLVPSQPFIASKPRQGDASHCPCPHARPLPCRSPRLPRCFPGLRINRKVPEELCFFLFFLRLQVQLLNSITDPGWSP